MLDEILSINAVLSLLDINLYRFHAQLFVFIYIFLSLYVPLGGEYFSNILILVLFYDRDDPNLLN